MNLSVAKINTFTIAELVYFLYFSVMTVAKGLGLYDGMWPYTLSLCAGAVLILTKLLLTKHTLAEWMYVLGLLTLGIIIWRNSGQTGVLIYITMIIGLKNVSVKRLCSLGLFLWGSTFVLQTLLTLTGLKSDIFVVHEKLGLGFMIRWSLGQPHPNVLQITFLIICAMILYVANWKGKKLILATILMFAANLYVFFYSVSYTGLILVCFYLTANLYLSFRTELYFPEKLLINLIFPACAAFAILGPVYFPDTLWYLCDKLLNTRFNIAWHHLTLDPISFLGSRPSDAIPAGLHNLDSSYVFVIMRYGLVMLFLMCLAYMAYIYHCTTHKKHTELAITIGLSVAAIAEPFFVNPSFKNISLIFVGNFIFVKLKDFTTKHPDSILNQELGFDNLGKKELCLPVNEILHYLQSYADFVHRNIKKLLVVFLCFACLTGTFFSVSAKIPSRYYVIHTSAQAGEQEKFLLDINHLPDDFEGKILNYRDAETPMQVFEGNISKVEYVRGIVSSGLWSGLFTSILFSLLWMVKNKNKK